MTRTFKLAIFFFIGLVAAAVLFVMFFAPAAPDAPGQEETRQTEGKASSSPNSFEGSAGPAGGPAGSNYPSALMAAEPVEIPDDLPGSLDGTDVPDGWARTDANGSLLPTPQLRQLFEYYLSALGEETLAQLIARIEVALSRLQEPARSEALATLGNYLDYKLELAELEAAAPSSDLNPAGLDATAMAQQLADTRSLRRRWLDADTSDAFFAAEEAVDEFQILQMRIRNDQSLSAEERAQKLQAAEDTLPPPIREARRETRKFTDYQDARSELGNDPAALQAWREEAFGPEAAEKLAAVETDQQAWNERWLAYRKALSELDKLGLAGPEQDAAIERLRDQHFDGPEKARAEALDSIQ